MSETRTLDRAGDVQLVGSFSWEPPESGYQFVLTLTAEGPGTLKRNAGHVARLVPRGDDPHPSVYGYAWAFFDCVPVTAMPVGEHADVALIAWRAARIVADAWMKGNAEIWRQRQQMKGKTV
jgi:hypothetical protein